jgi:predicted AlkP superfamily pyrophosphatase or phosphodiesterase
MKRMFQLLCTLVCLLSQARAIWGGRADHVVILVWDGMRPDFVSAQYTPTLNELAGHGTFFKNHHSSYITSTEVNGTALATGLYPKHSGVLANVQYRPELSWLATYGTENYDAVRRGDLLSDSHYLGGATMAETLQRAGIPTITAGSKPVVLLQDRAPAKTNAAQKASVTLFRGQTLPRVVMQSLVKNPEIGAFPAQATEPDSTKAKIEYWIKKGWDQVLTWLNGKPKTTPASRAIDSWTTKAVIHGLWKESVPKYTVLWLSEPDASQHESGVGSENAEASLERCDKNLSLIITALKDRGVYDQTDVFVVSDHAFSTVVRGFDLVKALKNAGFVAAKTFENPEAGDVLVDSLGGSVALYVFNHDPTTIGQLVDFLQGSDFAGVIFTSAGLDGTFPLSRVLEDAAIGAPDVLVSMHWTADKNDWGAPGLLCAPDGKRGRGTHASLSRFDLHNTLVAAGPDFKEGFVDEMASGNIDLAPTVLSILGVPPANPPDGRVLTEAMVGSDPPPAKPEQEILESTKDLGFRTWHQYLKLTRVGSTLYLDEGNGESRLK